MNSVRIVGGKWRSRRLLFPDLPELRPTPDRVRETLFNWLSPYIVDARCLDLFAGSGALGFEALSRGAAEVIMLDAAKKAVDALLKNAEKLAAKEAKIYRARFPHIETILRDKQFDIIFIDPPFNQGWVKKAIDWLLASHHLSTNALIYIEAEKSLHPLPIPEQLQLLREGTAGEVRFYLHGSQGFSNSTPS